LCDAAGKLIDLNHARAWLPQTLAPHSVLDVPIDVPAPSRPGRFTLKFDLVFEGVDWFERCGSQTTMKQLWTW
jgi:hypothetical protein